MKKKKENKTIIVIEKDIQIQLGSLLQIGFQRGLFFKRGKRREEKRGEEKRRERKKYSVSLKKLGEGRKEKKRKRVTKFVIEKDHHLLGEELIHLINLCSEF